ncbi:isochorismatase family protein, partial [Candidatus Binatia bacterium]|nr:isochorismatase family protein [Candidatus Binatia bacterium]
MTRALLLIDLQEDYLGAAGLVPARGELVGRAAWLLGRCRALGMPVVHVWTTVHRDDAAHADERMRHWRRDGVWRCVAGTPGHATPDALRPLPSETVVHKTHFSAFADETLAASLRERGVRELWLAGMHTHACVRATALDADRLGFGVAIASDAVASDQPLHADETRRYLTRRSAPFVPAASLLATVASESAAEVARPAAADERLSVAIVSGVAPAPRASLRTLPHECPSQRGRVLWHVPVAGVGEIEAALQAAWDARAAWLATAVEHRLAVADRIADAVARERETLARRMAL